MPKKKNYLFTLQDYRKLRNDPNDIAEIRKLVKEREEIKKELKKIKREKRLVDLMKSRSKNKRFRR